LSIVSSELTAHISFVISADIGISMIVPSILSMRCPAVDHSERGYCAWRAHLAIDKRPT